MSNFLTKLTLALFLLGHVSLGYELAVSHSLKTVILSLVFILCDAWVIYSAKTNIGE